MDSAALCAHAYYKLKVVLWTVQPYVHMLTIIKGSVVDSAALCAHAYIL